MKISGIAKIFGLLLAFIIVALVSYQQGKSSSVPANAQQIEEQVKNELVTLTAKDFEEYQNLKGLEERYKKADEILGKIVTVFLADLGLKLSFQPVNPAMIEGACAIPMAVPTAMPSAPTLSSQASSNTSATPAPAATVVASSNEWVKIEREFSKIHDEEQALEELKKMQIPDFFATLAGAQNFEKADELEMRGVYEGEINFFDKKAHPSDWIIRMRIQFQDSGDSSQNNSYITLSNKSDGKVFSNSRSNRDGIVKQNFSRPGGSKALIVNVAGDDGYIQIYPLGSDRFTWVGNYYNKKKVGVYEFIGQVRMSRAR